MNLEIVRLDANVGSGLLRIEARSRKVKAQAIFFDEIGKRNSADTMNVAAGCHPSRVSQVADTLAGLLEPDEPALPGAIHTFLVQALATAEAQTLETKPAADESTRRRTSN